jgi:glycoside/pentoside/hexuronide:cation symporter, GPH family
MSSLLFSHEEHCMAAEVQRLSVGEKVGYSLGDAAANFVFMTMILYQQKFYTDVFGIALSSAAWLLLVGRLWDAFFDPMMGVIADRTNTRWGKFRPWVLWTSLPWCIVMVLAYTTPGGWSAAAKVGYAAVTNILLMTLYSANNTPYSAMTGVMTGDVNERTSLSAYRFFAAMIAQLVVGTFTLLLVAKFGQGNDAKGWQMTIGLWAIVCFFCFLITFLTTRERIQPDPRQHSSAKVDFSNLLKNGPWIAMFIVTVAHFIYVAMRSGTMYYYFDYYLNKDQLYEFLQRVGVPTAGEAANIGGATHWLLNTFGLIIDADKKNVVAVGYSLFTLAAQFVTVIGVLFSTMLAMRFGKKAVALVGFILTTVAVALFILLPADAISTTYIMELVRAACYAPTIPLLWAMYADVADYAEWKTGRRTTGVIFATILFGLKAGLSLGGSMSLWLLDGYGYVANQPQTEHALLGIRMIVSVYSAIFLVIVVVCLLAYKITKRMNLEIQDQLAERRKKFQPA